MEIGRRACLGVLGGAALLPLGGPQLRTPLGLEKLYPAFAALPRAGLWELEPPLRLTHLIAGALGMQGRLTFMRDDQGGTLFGGGKARKLDLILGEAMHRGATAIATTGGTGSNHARSTAFAARKLGLRCELALLPEPETDEIKRGLVEMKRRQAQITVGDRGAVERARKAAEASGVEWIPMGGTSPLGNIAFVDAAVALAARMPAIPLSMPDVVVAALGSCGSAVGLAVGFAIANVPTRVVAVRCSSPATSSRAVVDAAIDGTVARMREIEPAIPAAIAQDAKSRLEIDGAELGGGYGVPTQRSREAKRTVWKHERIMLEHTYGAKAAAALIRRAPQWKQQHVMFWMGSDESWLAGRKLEP